MAQIINCNACGAPLKITGQLIQCEYCATVNILDTIDNIGDTKGTKSTKVQVIR